MDTKPALADERALIEDILSYHKLDDNQLTSIESVRSAAIQLVAQLMKHCPPSADRSAAIRHVREALFTANAAIALDGRSL